MPPRPSASDRPGHEDGLVDGTARTADDDLGRLVVVGASAGGVDALQVLVRSLPPDLPVPVLVVLHLSAGSRSSLPQILDRAGTLPARHAEDGEQLRPGHVYVAPPDRHLVVVDGTVRLDLGPTENLSRPSIDRLFRSAAATHGPGVIAVILSGMLDDGARGARTVRDLGGVVLVQDPGTAAFPSMPTNAIEVVDDAEVVPLAELGAAVGRWAGALIPRAAGDRRAPAEPPPLRLVHDGVPEGRSSGLTCPSCDGGLWELEEGGTLRFACRVGHAFSPEALAAAEDRGLERALWVAITALEERADLARRMARRQRAAGGARRAERYEADAAAALERSGLVHEALAELLDSREDQEREEDG